ncbi:SDR family oxidoreductase [Mangrovimicrobium sediminis]|uniref:SDR family oxidoreductase n=1 Tax=Mangrovimicrobium sediminis TaxID=2562682 RepID=A0A4Z0M1C4_9GAMM|nr:SDR family NAD(P)-dependent oxidoreductase [Haliea sp. SAOS-164]TGD73493.1 SDR family oxidoreductase [Haliea sp. SAOS-164]
MAQTIDMQGKVALVTGAASGLGLATAQRLAEAGATLGLLDIDADGLESVAAALRERGTSVRSEVVDLADPAQCAAAVAGTVEAFGRLDALCNVAGIIIMCNAHEMPPEQWQRVIAVNLNGPFYLMQAAIPHLLVSDGAVVNVSSSAAFIGEAYAGAYCASKAGLTNLTKALAMEYMHQPIRFNAVAPGGMLTNIANNMQMPEGVDYDLVKRYTGMRGLVEVSEVAEMVAMLASDAGRGFHGACINIDKGITAG